jgi:transglutaminase-like putative cysteine protease
MTTAADDLDRCTRPTFFLDSDHPEIVAFALDSAGGAAGAAAATRLFYAVRDRIRYDPYTVSNDPAAYRASAILKRPAAFCTPKAVLLAASARALRIPARLGFADVHNLLQSEKLRERMGTDLFVFHGYTELWLNGRWLKATPAFNAELCDRFGVAPLDFDGTEDAIFQAFTADGRRYMEYVRDRGSYDDLPLEEMLTTLRDVYGVDAQGALSTNREDDESFLP